MADDEFRTYTMMLLAVAPVLIDDKTSRNFLEQAQNLDGEMAWALTVFAGAPAQEKFSATRLDHAVQALKSASTPLLQNLAPEMRSAVRGDVPPNQSARQGLRPARIRLSQPTLPALSMPGIMLGMILGMATS